MCVYSLIRRIYFMCVRCCFDIALNANRILENLFINITHLRFITHKCTVFCIYSTKFCMTNKILLPKVNIQSGKSLCCINYKFIYFIYIADARVCVSPLLSRINFKCISIHHQKHVSRKFVRIKFLTN